MRVIEYQRSDCPIIDQQMRVVRRPAKQCGAEIFGRIDWGGMKDCQLLASGAIEDLDSNGVRIRFAVDSDVGGLRS